MPTPKGFLRAGFVVAATAVAVASGTVPSQASTDYPPPQFASKPVVLYAISHGRAYFRIVARLDRRLPALSLMWLGDSEDDTRPYRAASSPCYTQEATGRQLPAALRRPRKGQRTTVTIARADSTGVGVKEVFDTASVTIKRRSLDSIRGDRELRPVLRKLGCRLRR